MDWWGEVRLALQGFLDQHGVLAGFVLVLIEEAGVPVPVPGDFLMLALGVHARQGNVQLWQALPCPRDRDTARSVLVVPRNEGHRVGASHAGASHGDRYRVRDFRR